MEQQVAWSTMMHGSQRMYLAKTAKGLCYLGTPDESFEAFERRLQKHVPHEELTRDDEALAPYREEIQNFLTGGTDTFSLPIDARGTDFQLSVWNALREIPYGQTVSYSDIAEAIGKPTAVRAAASAIGANPLLILVPCHRVIGKNGALTGFRGGLPLKEMLLGLEKQQQNEPTKER